MTLGGNAYILCLLIISGCLGAKMLCKWQPVS